LLASCSATEPEPNEDARHDPGSSEDEYGRLAKGGIFIDRVTVDQAVAVDVFSSKETVSPDDYRTSIVSGRSAYVRALWDVPEDWTPRPIEARIGVHHADGSIDYATKTLDIDGSSNENWLEGAFAWYLPAEWIEADLGLEFTLYEVDEDLEPTFPPSAGARAPIAGAIDVGVSAAPRELDVLVVPIEHTYDGGKDCGGPPEIDEAMRIDLEEHLLSLNPVERVNVTVRDEVLVFDQPANKFGVILDELSALREKDDAPPWLYYYGLIDLCDWGSDQGYSGQARVPDEITPEFAWERVAVGTIRVSYGGIIGTFVHEVGHMQGRYHVPCDGEINTEKDYPHRDALTASMGFDLVKWVLHPATHKDYMSYCGPEWVSDYGLNRVLPAITTLTEWKLDGVSWDETPSTLVGSVYPDGVQNWWVVRGHPPLGDAADAEFRVRATDGREARAHARVRPHDLGEGLEVVVPLPFDLERIEAIEPLRATFEPEIDVDALMH
jgi:hypothetical protein